MEELSIIVDQRERNTELLDTLKEIGFNIDINLIPVGDYIVSDRVCIERKTVSDFESSIISGRLFDQLERLKETYELPLIILEGDQKDFRLGNNVINGTIASVYVDYGIPILFSKSAENTAELIASIAKREQNGKKRGESACCGS